MEYCKRPIGKETARKLAMAMNCDYREFMENRNGKLVWD
jgi:hypothetical protein